MSACGGVESRYCAGVIEELAEAEPAAATLAKFIPFWFELPSLSRLHMVLSELNKE